MLSDLSRDELWDVYDGMLCCDGTVADTLDALGITADADAVQRDLLDTYGLRRCSLCGYWNEKTRTMDDGSVCCIYCDEQEVDHAPAG